MNADTLVQQIAHWLEEKKAQDMTIIPTSSRPSLYDFMIIATGTSGKHLQGMAEDLSIKLKSIGTLPRIEGIPLCDWVLIDAYDVIIHLFKPEIRTLYSLEKLWEGSQDLSK